MRTFAAEMRCEKVTTQTPCIFDVLEARYPINPTQGMGVATEWEQPRFPPCGVKHVRSQMRVDDTLHQDMQYCSVPSVRR